MSKTIALNKGYFAIVDDEDYDTLIDGISWYIATKGYARGWRMRGAGRRNVAMHRMVIGAPDGYQVDHINGNKLDNRRSNLRLCNNSKNMMNRCPQRNNPSGYKGVTRKKDEEKWRARISKEHKMYHLGQFENPIDAAVAYDIAAINLFGEYAHTNFSKENYVRGHIEK